MKYLITLLLFVLSLQVKADTLMASMDEAGANITITFNDYADAEPFDYYLCVVRIDDWWAALKARRKVVQGRYVQQCLDQGNLVKDREYLVWFLYYDSDMDTEYSSPSMNLSTDMQLTHL